MIVASRGSICSTTTLGAQSGMNSLASFIRVKKRKYLYVSVITGNLLALSVGMAFAWSSPYIPRLQQKERLDNNPLGRTITGSEASWLGSLMAFGGMFGTFPAGYLIQKIGPKKSLLVICALPFIIGYLFLAHANQIALFYVGRVIAGLSVSAIYTVVPIYMGEISEDDIRGWICCTIVTFETFGELITFSVGPYLSIYWFCTTAVCITSIAAVSIIVFLPESPYYLLMKNDPVNAEKNLMKLRSDTKEGVKDEFNFMRAVVFEAGQEQVSIFKIFMSKSGRRAEEITIGLTMIQQFSGIVPIFMFLQGIFDASGTKIPPEYCSMGIGVVQFLSSFVAPNCIDRLGRRWMLCLSTSGMFVAEFSLGTYFYFSERHYDVGAFFWLPITAFVIYLLFYVAGIGPLLWTIMGEIFQPQMKSSAFSFGLLLWWSLAFVMSKAFHPLAELCGMGVIFWIFSCSCLLGIVFAFTVVVETKGKSFQEIQQLLKK